MLFFWVMVRRVHMRQMLYVEEGDEIVVDDEGGRVSCDCEELV